MASSKGSPGPHDRRTPYEQCIHLNRFGQRCKKRAKRGKLCTLHARYADGTYQPAGTAATGGPEVTPESQERGRTSRRLNQEAKDRAAEQHAVASRADQSEGTSGKLSTTGWVLNSNARKALSKLNEFQLAESIDPKRALLELVRDAHRVQQVWQAMLESVPDEDWQYLGAMPLPGTINTPGHRGTRLELIQRNLADATAKAARISKLAIDAGLEERMVHLAEQQSALIADTVRAAAIAAISSLHLSPEAEALALQAALGAAATHLRTIAIGPNPEETKAAVDSVAGYISPGVEAGRASRARNVTPSQPEETSA